MQKTQRGGTLLGLILGLLIGLGVAVGVALYITNAPIPFVNKVKPATENVNPAAGGKLPDPNKPLHGQAPATASAPADAPATAIAPIDVPKELAPVDAKTQTAIEEGSRFLLQAGAYKTPDDADAMRARLALMGLDAKVFPREEGGTTLYRVRLGPYGSLEEINRVRKSLADNAVESQLIRIK
ncbi:MAG: SPOR domain-containing protein [Burkholderiaceae bacterium]